MDSSLHDQFFNAYPNVYAFSITGFTSTVLATEHSTINTALGLLVLFPEYISVQNVSGLPCCNENALPLSSVLLSPMAAPIVWPAQDAGNLGYAGATPAVLMALAAAFSSPDPRYPIALAPTYHQVNKVTERYPEFCITGSLRSLPAWLGISVSLDFSLVNANISKWSQVLKNEHTAKADFAAQQLLRAINPSFRDDVKFQDAIRGIDSLYNVNGKSKKSIITAGTKLTNRTVSEMVEYYDIRCQVVHGEAISEESLSKWGQEGPRLLVEILAESYNRGKSWLQLSNEDRLLELELEED